MSSEVGVEVGVLNRPLPDNFVDSLKACLLYSSRDWDMNKRDAWLYGVIVGWEDSKLGELAKKFGWREEDVTRLKGFHGDFNAMDALPVGVRWSKEEGDWV